MLSYFSIWAITTFALAFAIFSFAVYLFTPPRNFPKNIPTIPFYYALLPLFKDVDQAVLYRTYLKEPLEEYGAAKIFFGGRWNILIRKPSYVAEMFKYEDIYAKSGNQKKIPHALVAEYTGDNIISAHGEPWKRYSAIIRPALQHDQDYSIMWRNSGLLVDLLLEASRTSALGVSPYAALQRYTLANLSEILYGVSFGTLQQPNTPLHSAQLAIKPKIFNPVFLNFPFLDHLKLRTRQQGRQLSRSFRAELQRHVLSGHQHVCDPASMRLGCRLVDAYRRGILSEKNLQDNLVSTFLAGHENPQLATLSTVYFLGKHQDVQRKLRDEINKLHFTDATTARQPCFEDIRDVPLLTAVIYESLRLFPPISQLLNRSTQADVVLGGRVLIPKGTYCGYNCVSTNRDTEFWGSDADEFRPTRWGANLDEINHLFRRANAKSAFISFHGGRRVCAGQKFAVEELKITIVEMIRRMSWTLDPGWDGRMTPAGPLYPRGLKIRFVELKQS